MENYTALEEVINDRLGDAFDYAGEEIGDKAFKDAMAAIDRYIALKKMVNAEKENELNLELEKEKLENSKVEQNKKWILEIVIGAGIPVVLFVGDCLFKRYYMRSVCNFEKDYTFTTTPGRSISGLFKFRK